MDISRQLTTSLAGSSIADQMVQDFVRRQNFVPTTRQDFVAPLVEEYRTRTAMTPIARSFRGESFDTAFRGQAGELDPQVVGVPDLLRQAERGFLSAWDQTLLRHGGQPADELRRTLQGGPGNHRPRLRPVQRPADQERRPRQPDAHVRVLGLGRADPPHHRLLPEAPAGVGVARPRLGHRRAGPAAPARWPPAWPAIPPTSFPARSASRA